MVVYESGEADSRDIFFQDMIPLNFIAFRFISLNIMHTLSSSAWSHCGAQANEVKEVYKFSFLFLCESRTMYGQLHSRGSRTATRRYKRNFLKFLANLMIKWATRLSQTIMWQRMWGNKCTSRRMHARCIS